MAGDGKIEDAAANAAKKTGNFVKTQLWTKAPRNIAILTGVVLAADVISTTATGVPMGSALSSTFSTAANNAWNASSTVLQNGYEFVSNANFSGAAEVLTNDM